MKTDKMKRLLSKAVKAVGEDKKEREEREMESKLNRTMSSEPMQKPKDGKQMLTSRGIWKSSSGMGTPRQPNQPDTFFWDRRFDSKDGDGDAPTRRPKICGRSSSFSSMTKTERRRLMSKEQAMKLMGLYSEYNQVIFNSI